MSVTLRIWPLDILSLRDSSSLPSGAEKFTDALPHNEYFIRANGGRDELQPTAFFDFFSVWFWISFMNRGNDAWIVCSGHFDYRVSRAQFLYTIFYGIAPLLFIPGNVKCWVAITVGGNANVSFHAGNGIDEFRDAVNPSSPLAV